MEEIKTGKIEKYFIDKTYGFIKAEDGNSYFFLFGKEEKKIALRNSGLSNRHVIYSGDSLTFKLKPSDLDQTKLIAYDLCFIENSNKEDIIMECQKHGSLTGRLKMIGNNLYVKHFSTNMMIFVRTSKWEIDMDDVYIENLDRIVKFKVFKDEKAGSLYAYLVDRRFCKEYNMAIEAMNENKTLEGRVLRKNRIGVYVQIFEDTEAFVSFPSYLSQQDKKLFNEQIISVKVKNILESRHIYLELA